MKKQIRIIAFTSLAALGLVVAACSKEDPAPVADTPVVEEATTEVVEEANTEVATATESVVVVEE